MSDRKLNNIGDSDFDRDLALTSCAYKSAETELPPSAIDDAIRAAARRAVKSQPQAVGKSWIARYSAPLSAAALVMLTVSIGFVALEERPELAPATLSESIKPKAASSAPPSAPSATPMNAPESPARGVVQAPLLSQPALVAEKKVRIESPNIDRDRLATSPKPDLERRRNNDHAVALGAILPKESNVADAVTSASAETARREAVQEKQLVTQLAAATRGDSAQGMTPKSLIAPAASRPQAIAGASVAPPLLVTADEAPDLWMTRILELKRLDKTREFEDELAKFRKRYPDYLLPGELKAQK